MEPESSLLCSEEPTLSPLPGQVKQVHALPSSSFKIVFNIKVFYLPTNAQENCFKKNIRIYIKTAPTCFGFIIIIRECIMQNSATDIHHLGPNNICGYTTELTTLIYFN
jgi:hypothetical protein